MGVFVEFQTGVYEGALHLDELNILLSRRCVLLTIAPRLIFTMLVNKRDTYGVGFYKL